MGMQSCREKEAELARETLGLICERRSMGQNLEGILCR